MADAGFGPLSRYLYANQQHFMALSYSAVDIDTMSKQNNLQNLFGVRYSPLRVAGTEQGK